jgi:hypothetical protein
MRAIYVVVEPLVSCASVGNSNSIRSEKLCALAKCVRPPQLKSLLNRERKIDRERERAR